MSSLPRPAWKLLSSLWMLSFVPVVAGVVRLSSLAGGANGSGSTPENARFMAMPAPVLMHIMCASLFCVLGALQFDSALRQRFPHLHRIAGRVAAPCGIVATLTGVWMTAAYAIRAALQGPLLYGVGAFFFRDVLMASAWGLNMAFAERVIRSRRPSP